MTPIKYLCVIFLFLSASAFAESSLNTYTTNPLPLPMPIEFDKHQYDVKDTLDPMLNYVAEFLQEKPNVTKLRIEGHVYTEKSSEENMKLSLQRAAMVSYYLTTKGIDCSRLLPVAFGDTKPVAPTDECNLQNNTRIGFYIAEVNNKQVIGEVVDGCASKKFNPCE
jgi:OmpA-OmpF porin, OOP family